MEPLVFPAYMLVDGYPDGYHLVVMELSIYSGGEALVVENVSIDGLMVFGHSVENYTLLNRGVFPATIGAGEGAVLPIYVLIYTNETNMLADMLGKSYVPPVSSLVLTIHTNATDIKYRYTGEKIQLPPQESPEQPPAPVTGVCIEDAILVAKHSPTNYANKTVVLQISIANCGDEAVEILGITVDNIRVYSATNPIKLNPGQVHSGTYIVIQWQLDETGLWEAGTEHIVTVIYRVRGQAGTQTVSRRVIVQ